MAPSGWEGTMSMAPGINHYTDIAVVAEEIEVIGGDIVAIIHVNLRPSPPRLLFILPP
jgi:hypothetical protein